jgi:DNA polymerase-3 subunit gamma/tau
MSYQVLARKWRPQDFSGLIGQEPIVTALRNALKEGRIAQAYLFSGIRGVGKTTAARLLAKALNCEHGPTPEPCNECTPCVEITRGSDLDVLEVDAATYSKVEQVRELTESLKYGSARDRYKVVVIDEIHRLSRQAFDALLKIVEEPPSHLVFVFATTEIEMVPATLLSRCQEFHFRRVPSDVVAEHLRGMAEAEEIEASDTSLRLIARAGEGSVRDAVALLDQLAIFGNGTVSDDEAIRLLGGLDIELFRELLSGIVEGRPETVREAVDRVQEEGWDPRSVYGQFLAYCRDGLHLAMGGAPERVDLPEEEARALAAVAKTAGYENLLRLSQQLLASEQTVRRSEAGTLALEIAWLRAAELPKLQSIEALLAGGAVSRAAATSDRKPTEKPPARTAPESPEPAPSRSRPEAGGGDGGEAGSPEAGSDSSASEEPPPDEETPPATVEAFLELVARRKPALAARLERRNLSWSDGTLHIRVPTGDLDGLDRPRNRRALEELTRETWGEEAGYRLVPTATEPAEQDEDAGKKEAEESVTEDETVQKVLDLFGGSVEAVEEHPQAPEKNGS